MDMRRTRAGDEAAVRAGAPAAHTTDPGRRARQLRSAPKVESVGGRHGARQPDAASQRGRRLAEPPADAPLSGPALEGTTRPRGEGGRGVSSGGRPPPPLALVTGGTRGIGLAIARKLAAEGARVFVTARHPPAAPLGGGIAFLQADAADEAAMRGAIAALPEPPDWLVCNAGTGYVRPLADTPLPELDRLWAVNVRGCLLAVQAARDGGRLRSAVLVGSDAGVLGEPATGAYSVTKAALIMMGRMLACDLGPAGTRVNVVCPGDTVPGMREMLAPGQGERPAGDWRAWPLPPLGRYGQPEDTAEAVAFLLSERAGFCNGSVLLVDGGSRAGRR